MSLRSLSVSLLVSSGPLGLPVHLRVALRGAGIAGLTAGGSIADEDGIRAFLLEDADLRRLCRLAEDMGILERDPRVEAVVDTSDSAVAVLLDLAHEKGARRIELGLMSSGYEGPDAAAMKAFFAALLGLAGLRDPGLWRDLADLPGPAT